MALSITLSSSSFDVQLTANAISSPFPHSQFSSVPLNFHFDLQTTETLASSSPNPCLHRPFHFQPQLLNSPALLSRTLYRFLSYSLDLDHQWRLSLAEVISLFISQQQPPLCRVDARIQIVRSQFVNPTPVFQVVDDAYVIDAADVSRETGSQLAVKEFVKKRSFECGDETEDECSICFENYRKDRRALKTECNHMFHRNCISKWLLNNNTCPMCRKRVC